MKINRILWHYTVGAYIPSIMRDGAIKLATANVPHGERPIVWFSSNQEWEQSTGKGWREDDGTIVKLDREQTAQRCGGIWRIGVLPETAPHNFQRLLFLSRMNLKFADALINVAREDGADPCEWFGTFHPVERAKWVGIEGTQSGRWGGASQFGSEPNRPRSSVEQVLSAGLAAYKQGHPVLVLDEQGHTLYGAPKSETSSVISSCPVVVHGVPGDLFNASDWPERLEAARQVYFY